MKIDPTPKSILNTVAFLIGCSALFSFALVVPQIFKYFSAMNPIEVDIEKIEIVEIGENYYVPHAYYTFGNTRQDEYLETFGEKNPYLLAEQMKEWTHGKNVGYLNHLNQCTLQKCFPVKQSVYTLILIALTLYFIFLGRVKA